MTNIIDFEKELDKKHANQPHCVSELICLNCLNRWIGVYPEKSWLKNMICKCGIKGKIIRTGQEIIE